MCVYRGGRDCRLWCAVLEVAVFFLGGAKNFNKLWHSGMTKGTVRLELKMFVEKVVF